MIPAHIIALEGPDRVGKKTQTKMLVEHLRHAGYKVVTHEIPFKTFVTYNLIYWMLDNGTAKKYPNVFQTIQFLNKWFFQLKLLWLRWSYDFIILDRWALSSIIYGRAGGANDTYIRILYSFLREPDLTFVLAGHARSEDELKDSYESDSMLQSTVRTGYFNWALEHAYNHVIIDNMGTRSEISSKIVKHVKEAFSLDG